MVFNYVKKDTYFDSVVLMNIAEDVGKMSGITQISVGMGTPLNKETLEDLGILLEKCKQAGPNDMMIAMEAQDEETAQKACEVYMSLLLAPREQDAVRTYETLEQASSRWKEANLAFISVPGEYAATEIETALNAGLNAFVFSDNVAIEDEARLKKLACEKGLFLLGPSCGLSQINGTAIGLCSKVRDGHIGIAAATGSGLQEVMCMIQRAGEGVSQAIGVGGRDLNDQVGAITMCQVLQMLEEDENTHVIIVISKPPQPQAMQKVLQLISGFTKPVVVQFIGCDQETLKNSPAIWSDSFANTAAYAIALLHGEELKDVKIAPLPIKTEKGASGQYALRGLYCGGALCEETLERMKAAFGTVYSNVDTDPRFLLEDPRVSKGHCLVDMGEEVFTKGRPHVAMDPSIRVARFIKEARDPNTAVILMDFLLGYALHEDPAGVIADVIREELQTAEKEGRRLYVVATICGSDLDPQDYAQQAALLIQSGVLVAPDNVTAAHWAIELASAFKGGI